jgi:hypothetical protein
MLEGHAVSLVLLLIPKMCGPHACNVMVPLSRIGRILSSIRPPDKMPH